MVDCSVLSKDGLPDRTSSVRDQPTERDNQISRMIGKLDQQSNLGHQLERSMSFLAILQAAVSQDHHAGHMLGGLGLLKQWRSTNRLKRGEWWSSRSALMN